ncbi:MAG: AAA family ATPase [Thermomicrobiales bacterium]
MPGLKNAGSTLLSGRERELEWLANQLEAALDGAGSLALISGEAGIGKSALLDAIASFAQRHEILILNGGAYDLTTPRPYALWIEVVSSVRDPEPPAFLTAAGSSNMAGSQAELFDAAVAYFMDLSADRPLLILLEDLHWADRESLDLLRAIARSLATRPALLVGTYRGDEIERDSWLARLRPHLVREARANQLDLSPLDQSSVREMVIARYGLDGQHRDRLVSYLYGRAEGNPLFTLELLRDLESSRHLRPDVDDWIIDDIESLPVPTFLRHLIQERLARLPDEIASRLAIAAVIGHEVPLELWGDISEMSKAELLNTLERAAGAGLVAALPDGQSLRFSHPLFREALYETTLPPRRAELHRRIAEALEASARPDPDVVAWHFQAASDRRAVEWLNRAADRARRAYAWRAAAERLIAIEQLMADDLPALEIGWLHYRIGRLLRHSDPPAAIDRLRRAEQLGVWSRDSTLTAYARFDLGHTEVLGGEFDRGLARMISGDALLDQLSGDPEEETVSAWVSDVLPGSAPGATAYRPAESQRRINPRRGTLVQWLVEPGRYDEAWKLGTEYLAQIEQLASPSAQHISSEGDSWYALGRIHAAMGRPEKAGSAFSRAIECFERIDHHLLISASRRAMLDEIVVPFRTNHLDERRALARQAEEASEKAMGALSAQYSAGLASVEQLIVEGEWPEARKVLMRVAERGASIESVRLGAVSQLGRLACNQGNDDEAWRHVRAVLPAGPETQPGDTSFVSAVALIQVAIELALRQDAVGLARAWLATLECWLAWSNTTRWQATARIWHARISAHDGELEQAIDQAMQADDLAGSPSQPLLQSAIQRLLGELALRQQHHDAARSHFESALQLARACAARYEIALTELGIAELCAALGQTDEALAALESGRTTLENLGATPALVYADRIRDMTASTVAEGETMFGLSRREREVLQLVAAGMTDAEVAAQLSISYRTVTTHLTSIFNKLGVNSRVLATRIAVENDLIE